MSSAPESCGSVRHAATMIAIEALEGRRMMSSGIGTFTGVTSVICNCPACIAARAAGTDLSAASAGKALANSAVTQLSLATNNLVDTGKSFDDLWTPLTTNKTPKKTAVGQKTYLTLDKYRTFGLDAADVTASLAQAPLEFTAAAARPIEISIPAPDGSVARFAVVETSVMDPALAAQFPDIKTYRGVGIDDPNASIRISNTSLGFEAQVLSPKGAFYIDPYWHNSTTTYASYYGTDASLDAKRSMNCLGALTAGVTASSVASAAAAAPVGTAARPSGTVLRTYRTAVATTGEYTAFFGGTVAAGQAAVVAAINRVTGVYESEMSIRLTLVANNSSLIFTNASTDPYTNASVGTMLGQNQTTLTNVIGSANYDIGHVFGTGDGGVASLGSVGQTSRKAQGVTGGPSPVGDNFWIDYVAHEMGHQFGANHTFNTSQDPNRITSTAYEPGSGSTIMAYAGIEGNEDIQPHSDPYFAFISQEEIVQYVDNSIPSIGVRTNTGNLLPVVEAGANYTIPDQTPFALTAVGSDGNGDNLTYSWEEADLGPAKLLTGADNGTSPLFRAYSPTTDPTRTFPRLATVLAGGTAGTAYNNAPSTNAGAALIERVATTSRPIKFNVTVRDSRAGGGGINSDTMTVTSVNAGTGFALTSQNTAATLAGGSNQVVTWDVSGTTANGINTSAVNIRLSLDGGQTFPMFLASNVANNGSATVQIPFNTGSSTARIKIEPVGNIYFDINNVNLTITNVPAASTTPSAPAFGAGMDTGVVGDNITKFNSGSNGTLVLGVPGTTAGSLVEVLLNGNVIGSATGVNGTTPVNISTALADGAYTVSARQTQPGLPISGNAFGYTFTVDATAAKVSSVSLDSTAWSSDFKTYLSSQGLGTNGYAVQTGTNQLARTLPWNNINVVRIAFNENVSAPTAQAALTGIGVNTAAYTANNYSYDVTSRTATFTLAANLTNDKLRLILASASVSDVAGNNLDGEFTTSSSTFPSGNGTPGGDLPVRINVLPGDANGDGIVLGSDGTAVRLALGTSTTTAGYNPYADFNGDGIILGSDGTIVRLALGQALPGSEPGTGARGTGSGTTGTSSVFASGVPITTGTGRTAGTGLIGGSSTPGGLWTNLGFTESSFQDDESPLTVI